MDYNYLRQWLLLATNTHIISTGLCQCNTQIMNINTKTSSKWSVYSLLKKKRK